MKKYRFNKRVQNSEKNADVTWINPLMPKRFNSTMISLHAYGESVFQPGYKGNAFRIYCWAVEYVYDGVLQISSDGESWRLKAGDVLLLHPHKSYARSTVGETAVVKREIMLNNSPLLSILCNRSVLNGRNVVHCTTPGRVEKYFSCLKELVSSSEPAEDFEMQIGNTVFAIFNELIYQCERSGIYDSFAELFATLDIFSADLSLEKMAAHFNVTKRTLNRIFHKQYRCSPGKYLIVCRMKYAAQLLKSNTLSIKAVGEECGYKSTSFFCSEFKKYYSMTPLEFRERSDFPG